MGRELRRKQAKKDGKNVKEVQKLNKEKPMEPKKFIVLMVALIIFCIIIYILTGIFVTKDIKWFNKKSTEEKEEVVINNKILAKDSLRQTEEVYYVYYYDTTKEEKEVTNIINTLEDKVYRVDLHDDFNSNFIGEVSGIVDDIDSLKVTSPTLIKVVSEKIESFYTGKDEIQINLG